MIKFFRKIRYNLMEQNKTGKYLKYAISEILLVVIGILIALSLNNWNEAKKIQDKERVVLKNLNKDFKNNQRQFNEIKLRHISNFQNQKFILRNIKKLDDPVALDSLQKYGNSLYAGYTFNASNGIVESLINSGDINIISNDTLKYFLISWKDVLGDYQEEEVYSRQLWVEEIQPYIIRNGDFKDNPSAKNIELLRDPIFVNMLARRHQLTKNIINEIEMENSIEHYINEIIRLSNVEQYE